MPSLPYAEMAELRHAIEARKVVRFVCAGQHYLAEPYAIENEKRTGAFRVLFFVTDGPSEAGWKQLRFWQLRDFEIQREHFTPRPWLRTGRESTARR